LKNATTTRTYKPDSVGPTVPVGASNRLIIYLGEPSPTPSIDLPVPAACPFGQTWRRAAPHPVHIWSFSP